jgi:hypothetical protein
VAIDLSTLGQNGAADGLAGKINVGTTNTTGRLRIYTGTKPGANNTATGTLLVEIPLQNPAYAASASGTAALAGTPLSAAAVAAGVAGWFRLVNRDVAGVLDGTVTATGGGGDLTLDNTNIATGQTVSVSSLNLTEPAS